MARANQTFYNLDALSANVPALVAKPAARRGLLLCNPNAAGNLLVSFDGSLTANYCIPLVPNEKILLDFTSPDDEIWVQGTVAGMRVVIVEFK